MASFSSRPLRQAPLEKSTSQYHRPTRTSNYQQGGSLPLFPTHPSTNVHGASASLIHDASSSAYGTIRKTASLRSAEPPQQQRRSSRTSSHRKVGVDFRRNVEPSAREPEAADASKLRIARTDPPEVSRENNRSTSSRQSQRPISNSFSTDMDKAPVPPVKIQKELRFGTVQVHFAEADRSPTKALEVDAYEKERGPTRAPSNFMKSEAELRDLRRIRQIEDARADEEWQAMREVNSVIQADVEENVPKDSLLLVTNQEEDEGNLGGSFLKWSGKKKKKAWIRGLFKRKQKAHPLADI